MKAYKSMSREELLTLKASLDEQFKTEEARSEEHTSELQSR